MQQQVDFLLKVVGRTQEASIEPGSRAACFQGEKEVKLTKLSEVDDVELASPPLSG